MTKDDIILLLDDKYTDLIKWLQNQPNDKWITGPEGKWTMGQQALHLLQSTVPLNNALSLPKFILRLKFGKANRAVRPYEEVVKRYHEKLEKAKGKTYKGSENMRIPSLKDKQFILDRLQVEQKKLQYKTKKLSNKQLNQLILPHPLMGKMPLRELIMWSAYHVEHHTETMKSNY
ncbi:MAG: DinB family protein [Bacteroidia bacterium]|nr:DinB family protein [Bacteroidia bacterium]NNF86854.1 DinB family protein [Winogradskyella sp.]NNL82844.1 DinB family protein [Winogradskyella sp.]